MRPLPPSAAYDQPIRDVDVISDGRKLKRSSSVPPPFPHVGPYGSAEDVRLCGYRSDAGACNADEPTLCPIAPRRFAISRRQRAEQSAKLNGSHSISISANEIRSVGTCTLVGRLARCRMSSTAYCMIAVAFLVVVSLRRSGRKLAFRRWTSTAIVNLAAGRLAAASSSSVCSH